MGYVRLGYDEVGLLSPCSMYHYLLGVWISYIFYKYKPNWSCVPLLVLHIIFEMWESSPSGIEFFFKYNHRMWQSWPDYYGDTVLNSQADNLCVVLGWYSFRWIHSYFFNAVPRYVAYVSRFPDMLLTYPDKKNKKNHNHC